MWIWLALGALVVLIGVVGWFGWRLARMRRAGEARAELLSELSTMNQRLGIGEHWETSLFQAHVIGMRGELNGFRVRGEVWDQAGPEACRISVRFPKVLRQALKVRRRTANGRALPGRGLVTVSTGDESFDACFSTMVAESASSELGRLLDATLRELMVTLAGRVSSLRVGKRSLFMVSEDSVDAAALERLLRDALRVAVRLYNASIEVGPLTQARSTQYEQVTLNIFGRESTRDQAMEAQEEASEESSAGRNAGAEEGSSGEGEASGDATS
ncbi:hypothetical protein DL240_03030 [Lujinxingia litoralis]|uniref:Uncharacterized protein n=1 Tax=Lujinxingia litoralis TaxID=2211119 RepID=A0A328CAZ7_9DELT|nr:hypothetical protein [Lujinxingia litoralis]RAL25198.1 hypothetical protein DL240_03030 [Lujinxingia litoralis]